MNSQPSDEDLLTTLASDLGFDLDDATSTAVLSAANAIDDGASHLYEPVDVPLDSTGSPRDDEFGALLSVYDEPRSNAPSTDPNAPTRRPLAGLSVAIKDVIAVRGLPLTCGSQSLSYVPSSDATVVTRLLDAGATLVGKANCDAFAFGPTGEFSEWKSVVNPAAPDRVPGGSSSGSGAAVAAGLVDVTLGTDTGGSVRLPASCCGVVGIKPTHGLVPRDGLVELAPSTDTIGPLAADVSTVAETLEAIAGPSPMDPMSYHSAPVIGDLDDHEALEALRVGIPSGLLDPSSTDVQEVVHSVVDALADDGTDVETVSLDLGDLDRVYSLVIATEFAWLRRQAMVTRGQGTRHSMEWRAGVADASFTAHVAKRVLPAALLDAKTGGRAYVAGCEQVQAFRARLTDVFASVDLLLTPTLRIVPPELGAVRPDEGIADIVGNTAPFSMSGNPAVSVPGGTVDGVPIGVQVVAPHFEDARALVGARLIERRLAA